MAPRRNGEHVNLSALVLAWSEKLYFPSKNFRLTIHFLSWGYGIGKMVINKTLIIIPMGKRNIFFTDLDNL
jgi:hypothetical protein